MKCTSYVAAVAGLLLTATGRAQMFINGDFAGGNLSGWTVANLPNGTGASTAGVATVDIDGPGPLATSAAASLRVGVVITMGPPGSGVEMSQVLHLSGGNHLALDFDWAVQNTSTVLNNNDGGTFLLVVNGSALAMQSAGAVPLSTWVYGHITAPFDVPATGDYTVGVRIIRSGTPASNVFQYIDNAAISGGAAPCYANCDGSTTPPALNVLDFACFLNRFAAGDSYANCDGSTTPPVLNVLDFGCFLNAFAAGCS